MSNIYWREVVPSEYLNCFSFKIGPKCTAQFWKHLTDKKMCSSRLSHPLLQTQELWTRAQFWSHQRPSLLLVNVHQDGIGEHVRNTKTQERTVNFVSAALISVPAKEHVPMVMIHSRPITQCIAHNFFKRWEPPSSVKNWGLANYRQGCKKLS